MNAGRKSEMQIKQKRVSSLISVLLILVLCGGSVTGARAQVAQGQPQQGGRERSVNAPRPVQTPPATVLAPPAMQTPVTTATPTLPAITAASRDAATSQALEDLRARIREITSRAEFAASHIAVKVASLDTGRVLYEEGTGKWLQPASNLKLYTVAAALDRFGPDYRFVTSVYAPARPDRGGTVRGDLIVYGRGDPTFATRFNPDTPNDYYRGIDELAARIVAAGVRRVEGDIIGDESYFDGSPVANGWEWDDLQWWYGAEVSALTVNDNSVDLAVKPGARVGEPCEISIGPATPLVTIVDRTTTSAHGTIRELAVHRPLGQNVIEVSGNLPVDDRGYTASVAVSHPALLFASMLRLSLERQGVVFTGRTRTIDARERIASPLQVSSLVEVAVRQSPPLSIIAAQTLKPSQNLYAELLLRALGKAAATTTDATRRTTDEAGIEAVRTFLRGAGVDANKVVMLDGSGLSRANLVTADATLALLVYMNRHRYGVAFRDALPVAGVDGTLRNRMKATPAQGNVRAKTGTLGTANSLSGYVFSASGERLVFSLMINNPPRDFSATANFTDAIAVLLASFTGHS